MPRRSLIPALAATALFATAASAPAAEITVTGWNDAPGGRSYDKLPVTTYGPSSAKTALVLIPGTGGGRGNFALLGKELPKRVPGLQVWAVDRRSEKLEDTSVFAAALRGEKTPQQALDYYVGWLGGSDVQPRYTPPDTAKLAFAANWGLRVLMEDTRRVVLAAKKRGLRVILGGHSLGASATLAYAAWDFNGDPGYRDIDGMLLLDGGLRRSFDETTSVADVKKRLAALRKQPFLDLLGLGIPWAAGVLAETGAIAARLDPNGPSIVQGFPLLPPAFKAPVPATNAGQFGYVFDATTGPKALSLIQVRAGSLAADGSWADGETTPIANLAETFGREPGNSVEWFYPARLNLDVDAASPMKTTAAGHMLGLRLRYAKEIGLPIYSIQSSLTNGRVLAGSRRVIADSKIRKLPPSLRVLVDASATDSHLDPLTAGADRSRFLQTGVPWLKAVQRQRP
ncbi:MAG: hypothetical protein V9E83_05310 [Baekduia sp.]